MSLKLRDAYTQRWTENYNFDWYTGCRWRAHILGGRGFGGGGRGGQPAWPAFIHC